MPGFNATTTGLAVAQVQQQQSQTNISNMSVDSYCQHLVVQETQVDSKGQAVGVQIAKVYAPNDPPLFATMQSQNSQVGIREVIANYLEQLQPFFGLFGRPGNLATQVTEAFNQLELAAQNPENVSFAKTALLYVQRLTSNINKIANEVQNQRLNADAEIATSTKTVNGLLREYHKLNGSIVQAIARGNNPIDFESQRDYLCLQIAKYIPVKQAPQANGSNWLYLTDGTLLVTEAGIQKLDFNPIAAMAPNFIYDPANNGALSGLFIEGRNVTNATVPGRIGGLFELRDRVLPAIQNQLDAFAVGIRDQLNARHNAGTAYAAPRTLTGNKTCQIGDAFAATGVLRVAVVGADKRFVEFKDINLTTTTTVGAFITAVNNIAGVTAQLTQEGTLQIEANTPANSIALVSMDPINPAIETVTRQGISDYFGLNNILESGPKPVGANTPATTLGVANVIKVPLRLLLDPGLYANGTLSRAPDPIPPRVQTMTPPELETWALTNGDHSNGDEIATAYNKTWTFPAAGGIAPQTVTLKNYAIEVISTNASATAETTASSTTAQESFLSLKGQYKKITGVSEPEEVTKLSICTQLINTQMGVMKTLRETGDLMAKLMGA